MKVKFGPKQLGRLWWVLGGLLLTSAAAAACDPWPSSPVLLRLFALPSSRTDLKRLTSELGLSAEQLRGLEQLAVSETRSAKLASKVQSRQQAVAVVGQISALQQDKDRQARLILDGKYGAFRQWIRLWWSRQVALSRHQKNE